MKRFQAIASLVTLYPLGLSQEEKLKELSRTPFLLDFFRFVPEMSGQRELTWHRRFPMSEVTCRASLLPSGFYLVMLGAYDEEVIRICTNWLNEEVDPKKLNQKIVAQ